MRFTQPVWTSLKQAKIKVAFTPWHINLCKMVIYLLKNIAKMALFNAYYGLCECTFSVTTSFT